MSVSIQGLSFRFLPFGCSHIRGLMGCVFMETKDPMLELLSSLEQIVFTRDEMQANVLKQDRSISLEPKRIREISGMQIDEFAVAMGVSISSVKSWEAKRTKPSGSAQKLMQLIHTNPFLGKQLLER